MSSPEEKIFWRVELEYKYVVLCKFCYKKTFDPEKSPNQTYLKGKCFYCHQENKKGKGK